MKTVRVSMDDDVYSKLSRKAKKDGLHSIALLLLHKSGVSVSDSATAVNLVRRAQKNARKQPFKQSFQVKDLLSTAWEGLSKGVRLRVGKLFLEDARSGKHKVKLAGKNSANHQLYQRTG
jgi:Domain of unknown function (DUF1413)